jgi:hypothetical protein
MATRKIKQGKKSPPLKTSQGTWARIKVEKAHTFAEHLAKVFQPHPSLWIKMRIHRLWEPAMEILFIGLLPGYRFALAIPGHRYSQHVGGSHGKLPHYVWNDESTSSWTCSLNNFIFHVCLYSSTGNNIRLFSSFPFRVLVFGPAVDIIVCLEGSISTWFKHEIAEVTLRYLVPNLDLSFVFLLTVQQCFSAILWWKCVGRWPNSYFILKIFYWRSYCGWSKK